ncbi:hypothetical protein ACJX0J_033539, partial [Zea mays]
QATTSSDVVTPLIWGIKFLFYYPPNSGRLGPRDQEYGDASSASAKEEGKDGSARVPRGPRLPRDLR